MRTILGRQVRNRNEENRKSEKFSTPDRRVLVGELIGDSRAPAVLVTAPTVTTPT
jgi:hypothetical protein